MPKPGLMQGLVLLLVFAAGLMAGLYLGGRSSVSRGATAMTSLHDDGFIGNEARDRVEQNQIYAKRIKELEDELAKLKPGDSDVLADHLDFLKKHLYGHFIAPINESLKISPEEADFLKITPSEKSAVEGHLAEIRSKLKAELQSKVIITKQSPTQTIYQIPVVPETEALSKQLIATLVADLGPDRAAALWQNDEGTLKAEFYYFGEGPLDVEITQSAPGSGNAPYQYKVSTAKSGWSGGGSSDGTLPAPYQGLIPFKPTPAPAP